MVRISWGLYLLGRTAQCLHFTTWFTIWTGLGPAFSEVKKGQHLGRWECGSRASLAPTFFPPEVGSEGQGGVPQGAKLAQRLSVHLHSMLPHLSDGPGLR